MIETLMNRHRLFAAPWGSSILVLWEGMFGKVTSMMRKYVLVIGDDFAVRELLNARLESAEQTVNTAETGWELRPSSSTRSRTSGASLLRPAW